MRQINLLPRTKAFTYSAVRILLLLLLSLTACVGLRAQTTADPDAGKPVAELSVGDAMVLGVVEGLTEFLPISSTGHLIIASHLLGLEADTPLTDHAGHPLWYKKPSKRHPDGEPLTLKLAADTYTVVIQVGAIMAVVWLYWAQLLSMVRGLFGQDRGGSRLLINLIAAVVPVGIIGLLASKAIEQYLFSIGTVIIGLVAGAVLMIVIERWRWRKAGVANMSKDPSDLYPTEAMKIGLFQCFALWPGTSRSMVTIVGGYLEGLSPAKAAEFSFLVGLPVLAGAALLKTWQSGGAMIEVFGWPNVLLGIAVAAVSATIAVKFLVAFLSRHGLMAFAVYRLVLAVVIAALFYL